MEDNRKQILSLIEEEISSLKSILASLEEKVIALSAEIPTQDDGPIDLSAPIEAPAEAPVEIIEEPAPVEEPQPVEVPVEVPVEAPVEAPAEPVEVKPKKTRAYKWMTDLPGVPVKNIRSAISLYDRALFIKTIFKENYALYDKTISDLNAMTSLDEAISYIEAAFPDWNFSSDAVYGFMMAIRKKLG